MRPIVVVIVLSLVFLGCKQNDIQKPDITLPASNTKTFSAAVSNVVVRAKITRLQSAGGGNYKYTVSLYVADAASPDVPLKLPGNLTVEGTLTDGKGVVHNFTVTLKGGTTTTSGNYTLPWPVIVTGSSSSPSVYNHVPIDFSGTFYEDCTKNYPGMVYNILLANGGNDMFSNPDITYDTDGNAYIVGRHNISVDADPGPGITMLTGSGGFIEKISPAGSLIWAKNIADLSNAMGMQIAVDKDKNIYVDWYVASTYHVDDFELRAEKFDPSGNKIWENVVFGAAGGVAPTPIIPDNDGNLYVGGSLMTKYGPAGNIVWQDKLYDTPASSITIADNKVNIWGGLNGTQDIDPGSGVYMIGAADIYTFSNFTASYDTSGRFIAAKATTALPLTGILAQNGTFGVSNDGILFRTDVNLNLLWQHQFNFDQNFDGKPGMIYSCFTADINANSYVCGIFEGTLKFKGGDAPYKLSAEGQNDFIEKRDGLGRFVWAIPTHPFTTRSQISAIKTDAQGNIYCTGLTKDMATGNLCIFIDKLSQCN